MVNAGIVRKSFKESPTIFGGGFEQRCQRTAGRPAKARPDELDPSTVDFIPRRCWRTSAEPFPRPADFFWHKHPGGASAIRSEFRTLPRVTFPTLKFRFRNMGNPRNVVGPQIRRLRSQQGLTQPMLAARCRRWGWDISRETLAKIETQLRWVSDFELLCLARALRVTPNDLWPAKERIPGMLDDFFSRLSASAMQE